MHHTIVFLIHEELGMASLCLGETHYLRNSTNEITLKNYLILIYASILNADTNSIIRIRNKSIYLLLKSEADVDLKGDSLRAFRWIQEIIYKRRIKIDLLSGNRVSRIEKKLDLVISRGMMISKEYKLMIDLDLDLGIDHNPRREQENSFHHIRKDTAPREVHLEGEGRHPNDQRDSQRPESDTDPQSIRQSSDSLNEVKTILIGNQYLHLKAGVRIDYCISDNADSPYSQKGNRSRRIPIQILDYIILDATSGKLIAGRRYSQLYK